ncbi:MAG: TonB-dependent receptor [Tannerella sp.]|nr:TonB-dependent receptor [Tannerella sp.]
MKLSTFSLIMGISILNARGSYSQETLLSLNLNNKTVREVFDEIERNSEFIFFYYTNAVDENRKVHIRVKNRTIDKILDDLFKNTDNVYAIDERQIYIARRTEPESLEPEQNKTKITGTVVDQAGEPVIGANIRETGTTNGTVTDVDGQFTLNVLPDATLTVSFIGYVTQEIVIGSRTNLNITLAEDNQALEEVVVIGYGTAKRQDFTGSIGSVKVENSAIANIPKLNVLEAVKGNVSGLNVGASNTAGGEPSMIIRGQNSISGSNNPLIVLDGVIYQGSLSDISPQDIATIDVLKDAVSSAVYGSRSANGVIAITTKKGKIGKPVITFNTSLGFQSWQNRPVMMKGEEWLRVANLRSRYSEGTTTWLLGAEKENQAAGKETVWLDKVVQTGIVQDYQVAVSGASEGFNYYLSTSYSDNKGITVGDKFNRISILGKINASITNWLQIGVDADFAGRDYSGFAANIGSAQMMTPYGAVYRDDEGNLEKYPYTQSEVNPLWGVNDGTRDNLDITQNFRLNAYVIVDIPWIKGLTFQTNFNPNLNRGQSGNFAYEDYYVTEGYGIERYSPAVLSGYLARANGNMTNSKTYSYVFDNILTYKNRFGKQNVEGTLVATRDYNKYEYINSSGSDFADNGNTTLGMWGLHKAKVPKIDLDGNKRTNIGYLGRLSYSYDDKYYLTGSFRRDGASVFGQNRKWGNFAATGAAWRISNEKFLKTFEPLTDLKLKLSWGQNGNQGIAPYATLSTVANGRSGGMLYEFSDKPGAVNYGLYQDALGNSDLGWEKTETWNAGFESTWLERFFVDLDLYFSKTTDQIFTRNIPVMTGFKTIKTSLGQVDNNGVELTVRSINIKSKDLTWNTSLTFWKNNNILRKLYGEDKDGDGKEDDDIASSLFIGKSLGSIYGYEQDGIVQEDDIAYIELTGAAPGSPKYKDIDGVPGISGTDRKILGGTKENFRLNMSNTVTYKSFELYVLISEIFGGNNQYLKSNTSAFLTGDERFTDNTISKPFYTPENRSNVYPSPYFVSDGRYLALQSRGFVRIQDISLSYSLNQPWIKAQKIKSLKIFFNVQNLATFTGWTGGDPETGATVAQNTYPVPSTSSLGINLSF